MREGGKKRREGGGMEEKEEEEIIRREEEEREGRVKKDWGWGHELTFLKLYLVLWVVVCILEW